MKRTTLSSSKRHFSSAQIIPLGFLLLIAVGTGMLLLPSATAPGEQTSFLTALFTATTSVCVTGLVVVDTFSHWSLFGKIIILILIQLGGLGVVAVSSSMLLLFAKRFSIKNRVLLRDAFNLDSISDLMRFLLGVIKGVFCVEGIGALLYAFFFVPQFGFPRGLWYSVFHSVSAFCNAGLDILGPDSLISYSGNPWLLIVTMLLIIIGGLGYIVWFDLSAAVHVLFQKGRSKPRLSEHSRLVLLLTAFLILSGAGIVLLLEHDNPATLGSMPIGQKLLNSLFQSVTFRTAGFAAVPQNALRDPTALFGCLMMFIGGSPMGTAGGVKTVTVFVLFATALTYIHNRRETIVFRRRISGELIRKSTAIVLITFSVSLLMTAALLCSDPLSMTDGLYEVFSATGTVGLSRGITAALSPAGRWIIIVGMYLGRIGPISLALFFGVDDADKNEIQHARGRFFVG